MSLNYLIDYAELDQPPFMLYGYNGIDKDPQPYTQDLSKVQQDIFCFLEDKNITQDLEDSRFSPTTAKIRGCAAYSIKAVFLKPSDSSMERWARGLIIFTLPVGHGFDIVVNSSILAFHAVKAIDAAAVGVIRYALYALNPQSESLAPKFDFSHIRCSEYASLVGKSMIELFTDTFCSPLYYCGFMEKGLKHTYWVYDAEDAKFHLVLDQGKVQWLQKKYGYTTDAQELKQVDVPVNPFFRFGFAPHPCNMKISYYVHDKSSPEAIQVKASWIKWKMTHIYNNHAQYEKVQAHAHSNLDPSKQPVDWL